MNLIDSGLSILIGTASIWCLHALGIVISYRASRVVNVAQLQLGAPAVVIAIQMRRDWGIPLPLCVIAGMVIAGICGAMTEILVIRRLQKAHASSRLVATVAIALMFQGGSGVIASGWVVPPGGGRVFGTDSGMLSTRFSALLSAVCASLLFAVVLLVLRGRYGVRLRAVFDSSKAAKANGINAPFIAATSWGVAGAISFIAGTLTMISSGVTEFGVITDFSPGVLMRALAVAAVAGFWSLPQLVAGGLGLASVEHILLEPVTSAGAHEAIISFLVFVFATIAHRGRFPASTFAIDAPSPRMLPAPAWMTCLVGGTAAVMLARPSTIELWNAASVYAMVGLSLVLLVGWAGYLSLGQFAIAGTAAVAGGLFVRSVGLHPFVALLGGAVAGGLIMISVMTAVWRDRGLFPLPSLALAVAMPAVILFMANMGPRAGTGVEFPIVTEERIVAIASLMALVGGAVGLRNIRRSRFGRALIATSQNPQMAEYVGINNRGVRVQAAFLSGALAGVGGVFLALSRGSIDPGSFGVPESLVALTMVVIGGVGDVTGAILGAGYLWGVRGLLPSEWAVLSHGTILLFIILLRPDGFAGLLREFERWAVHKFERRGRIRET